MGSRAIRPYPPGDFKIDGASYPTGDFTLSATTALSWAHRDRVAQGTELHDASESDIGPEAGVTYTAQVRNADTDGLLLETTGITGTSTTIDTRTALIANIRFVLFSVRDGFNSFAKHIFDMAVGAWTPDLLTTALWLDVSDSTTVTLYSTKIGHIDDKSPTATDATQGTDARRPTLHSAGLNSLDTSQHDGSDDFMFITSGAGYTMTKNQTAFSTFMVLNASVNATTTGKRVINFSVGSGAGSSTNGRHGINLISSKIRLSQRRLDTDALATAELAHSAGARIVGAESDWSAATAQIWIDGVGSGATATGQGSGSTSNTDSNESTLGGTNSVSSQNITGDIAELICVQGILSTSDRQKVEGYLAWKWGLVANLDAGHPYKSAAPTP